MKTPDAKTWVRIALVSLALAFVAYMILIPAADALLSSLRAKPKGMIKQLTEMTFAEQIRLRTIEGMTAFWFFAVGASIGSFLNVVVYRMPMGESLVFKPSRCPNCQTPIAGRDNIPILGWLSLGGRCRACGISISLRYPTVEIIAGTIFLLLYFVELISGGMNLPIRPRNMYAGAVWIVFFTKWDLVTIYLYHCVLMSMLLTLALVDLDRKRLPWTALLQFGLILVVPACLFPHLLLVPLPLSSLGWNLPAQAIALITILTGAVAGLALGLVGSQTMKRWTGQHQPHFTAGLVFVGVALGWQAAIAIFVFSCFLKVVWSLPEAWLLRRPAPTSLESVVPEQGAEESEVPVDIALPATEFQPLSLSMFLLIGAILHQIGWRWIYHWLHA